jgi:GMP synthase (glutamine-hydrolysing)
MTSIRVVEPLKSCSKTKCASSARALGLPDSMVYRQPFPAPVSESAVSAPSHATDSKPLRESDAILREEFFNAGLQGKVWQYFTIVPDFKSTAVKGVSAVMTGPSSSAPSIRAIAMTATVERIPYEVLEKIVSRITSEVKGVNRVLYDLTPKPTGTIEWE